jgi:hypothetical protein
MAKPVFPNGSINLQEVVPNGLARLQGALHLLQQAQEIFILADLWFQIL